MKKIFLILMVSLSTQLSLTAKTKQDTLVRKGYQHTLLQLLKGKSNSNDMRSIEYIIPINQAESIIYFSSDYTNEQSKVFQTLQKKILSNCMKDNVSILKKYLYLSQFVDGYFAEDYFDNIEKIAKAKKAFFCSILNIADKRKTERLVDIKEKYCK